MLSPAVYLYFLKNYNRVMAGKCKIDALRTVIVVEAQISPEDFL